MTDRLVQLAANKRARTVITTLGLPVPLPQTLKRGEGGWIQVRQVRQRRKRSSPSAPPRQKCSLPGPSRGRTRNGGSLNPCSPGARAPSAAAYGRSDAPSHPA